MDSVDVLLARARLAGLRLSVEPESETLTVEGPDHLEDVAREVLDRKPEVLCELAAETVIGALGGEIVARTTGEPRKPGVLNLRTCPGREVPAGAVLVDRRTPFGNPYLIGKDGTRTDVIAHYERWLLARPDLVEKAKADLAGRDLVCWCAPKPCHADVLLRIANSQGQP